VRLPCNHAVSGSDGAGDRQRVARKAANSAALRLELFMTGHALLSVKTPQPDLAVVLPVKVRIAVARAVGLWHVKASSSELSLAGN
jgi:hypothetical protein